MTQPPHPFPRRALLLSAPLLLAACLGGRAAQPARLAAVRVDLAPAPDLARSLRVEVVFPRTQADLARLSALTAADWFARPARVADPGLDVHRLTVEPGVATTHRLGPQFPAAAIMIFADYPTPGPHRVQAAAPEAGLPVKLRFAADDFQLAGR